MHLLPERTLTIRTALSPDQAAELLRAHIRPVEFQRYRGAPPDPVLYGVVDGYEFSVRRLPVHRIPNRYDSAACSIAKGWIEHDEQGTYLDVEQYPTTTARMDLGVYVFMFLIILGSFLSTIIAGRLSVEILLLPVLLFAAMFVEFVASCSRDMHILAARLIRIVREAEEELELVES